MKNLIISLLGLIIAIYSNQIFAQNLLVNGDFSQNGGSLDGWGIASGTSLGNDGNQYFAVLHGENGVLYQKVSNVTPGKTYECTMKFRNLKVKQTTGYGYAIEFETPLVLPEFTVGATNLRDFCNNNNGEWTTLENNLVEQNVTKSYNVIIPENATAVYICLGTKGAIADMQVDEVDFRIVQSTKVNFTVINKATGELLDEAQITIDGLPNFIETDAEGKADIELVPSDKPYAFKVRRDWFEPYESTVLVGESDVSLTIELDSIQEVKNVETRISKYGDNATPYPLYGHFWSNGLDYSDEIADSITKAFDYIVGGSGLVNTIEISEKLHQSDPDFQIIRYQGGWDISAAQIGDRKLDLLYYRCGVLASDISETDNQIVLNKTPDNKGLGLVASEEGSFITWIRIGNELMKIISVSGDTYPLTVTVQRGYENTTPQSHIAGSAATAPLFENIPVPGGNNANMSFFNPVFGPRKNSLRNNIIAVAEESGQDGVWIDILVGLLGAQNMVGGNYTLWDHEKESVLTNEVLIHKTKDAVNELYNGFYSRMGYFPVIYGNNVLFSSTLTSGDRAYVMVKTEEHPRGLDGFCHENSWGHMSDDSGNLDNDGKPINSNDKFIVMGQNGHYLEWYMGNTWIANCKAIALLAENNLPNQPMTINAGFKNQWFAADLTDEVRYNFNKYAYASYLLCVNVTADSLISCRMGISPMTVKDGKTGVNIEPFFYYPIGIPVESNSSNSFEQYRVGNYNLFARKFSNGIVLVNPFSTDMDVSVPLSELGEPGKIYIDPENSNSEVTSVKLKSRESKILLIKSVTGIDTQMENNDTGIKVYPVPVKDILNFSVKKSTPLPQRVTVEIYNTQGIEVKRAQIETMAKNFSISCNELPSGLYFYRIPELKMSGKFTKSDNQ